MARPQPNDSAEFYHRYIEQVQADNVKEIVEKYNNKIISFFQRIDSEKADYAYAEGKWSIKELLQHIIDAERVFCYRVLRFSRKDNQPLLSFDENIYVKNSLASKRDFKEMLEEFFALRKSTDLFYLSLTDEQLKETGIASGWSVTVTALVFITYGHLLHHMGILKERYFSQA
ncbi:MAG: DinB family protein [Chitinophagaceae bacterium]|nr:DinB family protein [Chitinophagaceae bacterium]